MNPEIRAIRKLRTELKAILEASRGRMLSNRTNQLLERVEAASFSSEVRQTMRRKVVSIERYMRANEWGSAEFEIKRFLQFISGLMEECQTASQLSMQQSCGAACASLP